jgi:hypothetical protein
MPCSSPVHFDGKEVERLRVVGVSCETAVRSIGGLRARAGAFTCDAIGSAARPDTILCRRSYSAAFAFSLRD